MYLYFLKITENIWTTSGSFIRIVFALKAEPMEGVIQIL